MLSKEHERILSVSGGDAALGAPDVKEEGWSLLAGIVHSTGCDVMAADDGMAEFVVRMGLLECRWASQSSRLSLMEVVSCDVPSVTLRIELGDVRLGGLVSNGGLQLRVSLPGLVPARSVIGCSSEPSNRASVSRGAIGTGILVNFCCRSSAAGF